MKTREISIKELLKMDCDTFSKKTNTPRGVTTVLKEEIKVGDKVVLSNYFTLVTD